MCYVLPWGQICLLIIHQGCMKAKQGHIHTDRKGRRITHAKHGKDRKEAFLRKQCFSVRLLRLAAPLTGYKLQTVMYLQVGALNRTKATLRNIGVFCYLFELYKEDYFFKGFACVQEYLGFSKVHFQYFSLVELLQGQQQQRRNSIALGTLFDLVFRHKQAIVCAKSNIDEKIMEFLAS